MRACSNNIYSNLYKATQKLQHRFYVVDDDVLSYLPFCRQNLLMVSNWSYKDLYFSLTKALIKQDSFRMCDKNEFRNHYFEFTSEKKISNPKFVEFFIEFFTPLYLCTRNKIERDYNDVNLPVSKKFSLIGEHIANLYNLIALQLYGLDISCTLLKDSEICNKYECKQYCLDSGCEDCTNQVSNTIVLFVNPFYYESPGMFDEIVDALKIIKDPKSVILFVDYTYVVPKNSSKKYNWSEHKAIERYNRVKEYVAEIYFMSNLEKIDFGEFKEQLDPYIIRNEKEYSYVYDNWIKNKVPPKLTDFRSRKR